MEKPINKRVVDLIEQYNFDQLSVEQRNLVLAKMSEADYRSQRFILLETRLLKSQQDLKAPDAIKAKLQEEMVFVTPKAGMMRALTFGVPLWLIGLLGLLGYLMWSYKSDLDEQQVEELVADQIVQEPEYIYVVDTVYQEIESEPVVITKVVTEEVIRYIEVEVPVDGGRGAVYVAGSQEELGLVAGSLLGAAEAAAGDARQQRKEEVRGLSVAEDPVLMELLDNFKE